jgi:hypothetical protein
MDHRESSRRHQEPPRNSVLDVEWQLNRLNIRLDTISEGQALANRRYKEQQQRNA